MKKLKSSFLGLVFVTVFTALAGCAANNTAATTATTSLDIPEVTLTDTTTIEAATMPSEMTRGKIEYVLNIIGNRSYSQSQSGTFSVELKDGKVVGNEKFIRSRPTIPGTVTYYGPDNVHKWFPEGKIQVGMKWNYRYRLANRWSNVDIAVVKLGNVTLKAGTFKVYVLQAIEHWQSITYYYAPELGAVVFGAIERERGDQMTWEITSLPSTPQTVVRTAN